jgi:hypothetical protein
VQVPFYSELADEELRAYFLIGLAVGESLQNLRLTVGQRFAAEAGHQLLHQRRRYARLARVDFANTIQQLLTPSIL